MAETVKTIQASSPTRAPVQGPRAWTTATLDSTSAWYYQVPELCRADFETILRDWRASRAPLTDVRLGEKMRASWTERMAPVLAALEAGRGFVIFDRAPVEHYNDQEAQLLYWLLGQGLGHPVEQNVEGVLLYDVRDTGQNVAYGARFSVTNSESSFHTDNSFGNSVTDYIGLLCLKSARSGGVNLIVSAYTICNELLKTQPKVMETLCQPFHVDRRGGLRPGEGPTSHVPLMEWHGSELTVRYLRYWIESGHEKVKQPLSAAQVEALDLLDQQARRSDLAAEFSLKPGEMLFVNNRWILHNRTAFEDHAEPERSRHLVRLWLKR